MSQDAPFTPGGYVYHAHTATPPARAPSQHQTQELRTQWWSCDISLGAPRVSRTTLIHARQAKKGNVHCWSNGHFIDHGEVTYPELVTLSCPCSCPRLFSRLCWPSQRLPIRLGGLSSRERLTEHFWNRTQRVFCIEFELRVLSHPSLLPSRKSRGVLPKR